MAENTCLELEARHDRTVEEGGFNI